MNRPEWEPREARLFMLGSAALVDRSERGLFRSDEPEVDLQIEYVGHCGRARRKLEPRLLWEHLPPGTVLTGALGTTSRSRTRAGRRRMPRRGTKA